MPDYSFRLLYDVLEVMPKPEFLDSYGDRTGGNMDDGPSLSSETYARARDAAPGWDVRYLEQEWRMWMSEPPRHADSAFIGFCRKWYERNGRPS